MTDVCYVFICARDTYPINVPQFAISEADYRRKVSNAFSAISGGFRRVGDLVLRPNASAFDDHLLCDGTVIQRASFPQLVTYLAGATASSATLPDYRGAALTVAAEADTPTQVISDGGTVSTGGTVTTPTTPAQTGGTTGGNVSTGGRRPRTLDENFE